MKHLQKELRDAGMNGRFSESRAKEIKEQRELMADLEAVKEGEKSWGMGREEKRVTRGGKKIGADGAGDADGESRSEEDEEDEEDELPARRQRARQELAFLDDDDEESD